MKTSSCGFVFYTAFVKDLAVASSGLRGSIWGGLRSLQLLALVFSLLALAQSQSPSDQNLSNFSKLSAQADTARDADRLDSAVLLYKKALALRPSWAEGWWSLGTIQYDRNSYEDATQSFRKLITVAPTNGNAFAMLGLSEFELGNEQTALEHIQKGVNLGVNKDPSFQHVLLYHEGVLQQRLGRFESARAMLQELCIQGVRSEEVVTALGLSFLRLRTRSLEQAPQPSEIVTLVGRGACLAGEKKFDDARKEMQAAVDKDPNYPRVHFAFGLMLVDASDNDAAIGEFKLEIENNPSDVVSRLQIAAATYKTNSPAGVPYAKEAVELAPREAFAHYLLGLLLLDTDDYQKAIPELEVARQAYPRDSRVYLALGTAYSRAERKEDAAKARAEFQRLQQSGQAKRGSQDTMDTRIPGVGVSPPH